MVRFVLCFLLAAAITVTAAISFVRAPSIVPNGLSWTVDFELSDSTDVEVSIIDMRDSTVVCHLAAGVLGANPPAPLASNALRQTLAWDGKDDFGSPVSVPEASLSVRVRAGMKAELAAMVGGNPRAFKGIAPQGNYSFNGFVLNADGHIYMYGTSGMNRSLCIRQFDTEGNYLKTVFPWPANAPAAKVSGFGVWTWENDRVAPKTTYVSDPNLTSTFISGSGKSLDAQLLPLGQAGELYVCRGGMGATLRVNADGTLPDQGAQFTLVTGPRMTETIVLAPFGCTFLTQSHNPDYAYFSAYWQAEINPMSCHLEDVVDTGFFRDGQVFKLNLKTGELTSWLRLDSAQHANRTVNIGYEYMSAIHGTAIDDKGHVFVCERQNSRVAVYDTNAVFKGSIAVSYPDMVYSDNATGHVYVLTRNLSNVGEGIGIMQIKKFSGWTPADSLICQKLVTTQIGYGKMDKPYFAVVAGAKPVIWIAYGGLRAFRDDGDSIVLFKDFSTVNTENTGFDRISVDRQKEVVYINDSWKNIYKIEDWSNPKVVPCSTSTGKMIEGWDMAVSFDGQLYVRNHQTECGGPLSRYTTDHYHAPIPFANSGTNVLTQWIDSRWGAGFGEHGLAVSPDKKVSVMFMQLAWSAYLIGTFGDSTQTQGLTTTATFNCNGGKAAGLYDTTVMINRGGAIGCGGVRYDTKGNLYFGVTVRNPGVVLSPALAADLCYSQAVGSVVKMAPGCHGVCTSMSYSGANGSVAGSERIYTPGLSPLAGLAGDCNCRSPRFDVDNWGRVFMPNALAQRVSVTDNNDNLILTFGEYGNYDSWGPGSPVPTSDVPFAWPVGVGVSDNYMYVTDMVNTRLVRVKMGFDLDNMPGMNTHTGVADSMAPLMSTLPVQMGINPNPFNPECRIALSIPATQNLRVDVYDINGRFVKSLANGRFAAGTHALHWNATDTKGLKVSAGVYLYKLDTGNRILIKRAVLAK